MSQQQAMSRLTFPSFPLLLLIIMNIILIITIKLLFLTSLTIRRTAAKLRTPSELLIECPSVLPPCPFIRYLHHHAMNNWSVCCHHQRSSHQHSHDGSQHQHKILSLKKALTGTEYRTANGFSRRYERQHRLGLQGKEGEHTMIRLILNDDPGFEEEDHHYLYDDVWKM